MRREEGDAYLSRMKNEEEKKLKNKNYKTNIIYIIIFYSIQ